MTNLWNTHPKNYGAGSRQCNGHAIIRKYALNICRQCFRERANQIGFLKIPRRDSGIDFGEVQNDVVLCFYCLHLKSKPYISQ